MMNLLNDFIEKHEGKIRSILEEFRHDIQNTSLTYDYWNDRIGSVKITDNFPIPKTKEEKFIYDYAPISSMGKGEIWTALHLKNAILMGYESPYDIKVDNYRLEVKSSQNKNKSVRFGKYSVVWQYKWWRDLVMAIESMMDYGVENHLTVRFDSILIGEFNKSMIDVWISLYDIDMYKKFFLGFPSISTKEKAILLIQNPTINSFDYVINWIDGKDYSIHNQYKIDRISQSEIRYHLL